MRDQNLSSVFPAELFVELGKKFTSSQSLTLSGVGNLSAKSLLCEKLLRKAERAIVWITNDPGEARLTAEHLIAWQSHPVTVFVAEKSDETERERTLRLLRAARALQEPGQILITTYRDAQTLFPDIARLSKAALEISAGALLDRTSFFNDLIELGFESVDSEDELTPGSYRAIGSTIQLYPAEADDPVTLDLDGEKVESISGLAPTQQKLTLLPISNEFETTSLLASLPADAVIVIDEIILDPESADADLPPPSHWLAARPELQVLQLTSFPDEEVDFVHLRFLSVLKYVTLSEFIADLRIKKENGWRVSIQSKQFTELKNIFDEHNFSFSCQSAGSREPISNPNPELLNAKIKASQKTQTANCKLQTTDSTLPAGQVLLLPSAEEDFVPYAFQNPELKIAFLTDREIFGFQRGSKSLSEQKVYLDFIASLRDGDFVVHLDHGIGIFRGIEQKTIEEITREYLRLDYAAGDKLFVPIDQADKVNRFIGAGDAPPRLTRLGSSEWTTVTKRVAAETEKIAKELLALYAARAAATGVKFGADAAKQLEFEKGFPYEETPGQQRAIEDVKRDMESPHPMDRLVCGDVGFGKTEVAMRAAFKAVMSGKQVAFISPITILTDQHYQSFSKRLVGFDVSCEMLSRFKTPSEQRKILEGMADGTVQIVIGTHRLLQEDVKFKNLGLVIIDEEQRFGVKQKEKLKALRSEVDVLTMTATPIPRTLNMALNRLRDISTITTPPPGRLPIVTEVRHFSWKLIEDAIKAETARKGQVYFLHNRVATIDGIADKLRSLVPEAKFVVTHGQLKPDDLEERILDFKAGKYDVLVSSAIIENGIDLPNANTLIVNDADNFGLSQLYQLRGRVGRSRTQAYAYFMYGARTLKPDAKKRLRAIVEASELGAGFEIAMKDLEIRGAGDILGANQSGAINVVGVSHFVRMLNQAVEDLKSGKQLDGSDTEAPATKQIDVTLELPLSAFIPTSYISDTKEKIRTYQKISAADSETALFALRSELMEEYGKLPLEVANLFKVLRIKLLCRRAGVTGVKVGRAGVNKKEAVLILGQSVKPANIMSVLAIQPKWSISGERLRIDAAELGVDWVAGLREAIEAMTTEYRADMVKPKE